MLRRGIWSSGNGADEGMAVVTAATILLASASSTLPTTKASSRDLSAQWARAVDWSEHADNCNAGSSERREQRAQGAASAGSSERREDARTRDASAALRGFEPPEGGYSGSRARWKARTSLRLIVSTAAASWSTEYRGVSSARLRRYEQSEMGWDAEGGEE